jgi:formylglycine-generating enzyme required for sulfatase activity
MEMVYVPAGEFQMGAPDTDGEASDDERPQHTVHLDGFWIDRYEVTNAQYQECVTAGACPAPLICEFGTPTYGDGTKLDHPVVCVSWIEAVAYCQWAGARLPTEAEWEKAARGNHGQRYPWGDSLRATSLNLCDRNCEREHRVGETDDGYARTAPVGHYPEGASPYGAQDMAGNVWEWVADWYDADYYAVAIYENPSGTESGTARVSRGGSWDNDWHGVRATCRNWDPPRVRGDTIGFRCCLSSAPHSP